MIGRPVQLTPKLHPAMEAILPLDVAVSDPALTNAVHRYLFRDDVAYMTSSGGAISAVLDQIGSLDYAQSTAANKLSVITEDANINDQDCAEGDGGDFMTTGSGIISQPYLIWMVALDGDYTGNNSVFFDNDQSASDDGLFRGDNSNNRWRCFFGNQATAANDTRDSSWHAFTVYADGVNSYLLEDDTEIMAEDFGSDQMDGKTLFQDRGGSNTALAGSRIAEMIIYDADLSAAEKVQNAAYRANIYGL